MLWHILPWDRPERHQRVEAHRVSAAWSQTFSSSEALRPEPDDIAEVKWLVERHLETTGSLRASELLKVWDQAAEMLWHILPWDRPERHQRVEAHRVSAA